MNDKLTGKTLKVRIPNYLTKIQTSKSRRPKYWLEKDKEKLPIKLRVEQFIFKKDKLFDTVTKEFVIKNAGVRDKPRFQAIAGNEIMRMHEMIRVKIVNELKDHFKEQIVLSIPDSSFKFEHPVRVQCQVECHYGSANFDADNMWIYHKCFLDALVDLKIITNDNILHVRDAGRTRFLPIPEKAIPAMEFVIEEIDITDEEHSKEQITIIESQLIKPGEIWCELNTLSIGTGRKKVIYGAAKKAVRRAMYYCLNNFKAPMVSKEVFEKYKNFFECFEEHRIKIIKTP